MGSVYNPSASILENYIKQRQLDVENERAAQNDEAARANIKSQTDFRNKEASGISQRLEDEHKAKMAELDAHQATIEAQRAALAHAHLQSKLAIIKGVHDGEIPVPAQQFQGNGQEINPNLQGSPAGIQAPPLPQGQFQNAPLSFDGQTIQGNEYTTPQQSIQQTAPLRQAGIEDIGKKAAAETKGKLDAEQPLFNQQQVLEQKKLESAERIASVKAISDKYKADQANAARLQAAQINASARRYASDHKSNAKEVDPGAIEDRAEQLRYAEGPTQGHNATDLAALAVNSKLGFKTVNPDTLKNIKGLKPLEEFSTQMTDFAEKYLGNGLTAGPLNVLRINSPLSSDEKNDYNKLILNSTNIAKGVEGAAGRTLLKQIETAQKFIANPNVTKSQMIGNAKSLNDAIVTAVDGQLGHLSPKQRVDFLKHTGFDTIAAYTAAKYKLAEPKKADDQWVDVGAK